MVRVSDFATKYHHITSFTVLCVQFDHDPFLQSLSYGEKRHIRRELYNKYLFKVCHVQEVLDFDLQNISVF